jgi:hypothetical protein
MDNSPQLVTGNPTVDHWLAILGIAVTLSSAAASFLNSKIREAIDSQGEAPKVFVWLALVINYLAFNADKAMQMQKLLGGGTMTVTKVAPPTPPAGQ